MNYKNEVKKIEDQIDEIEDKIWEATKHFRTEIEEAKKKIRELEDECLSEYDDDVWISREWTCNPSPIGWCLMDYEERREEKFTYDDGVVEMHRYGIGEPHCIICGDPEERK